MRSNLARMIERAYTKRGDGCEAPPTHGLSENAGLAAQYQIRRHKYVAATPAWGSPWVRTWHS